MTLVFRNQKWQQYPTCIFDKFSFSMSYNYFYAVLVTIPLNLVKTDQKVEKWHPFLRTQDSGSRATLKTTSE